MKKKIEKLEMRIKELENELDCLEEQIKETKRLEERIRALENDLDDMSQEIEHANKVRRAVVEIQEFLTKKANGYDVDFSSYLIRLKK